MAFLHLSPEEIACLHSLADRIGDAALGLPEPVFQFALETVPMVNVDLLVLNDKREVLLAWREDAYAKGWHVPGGIIRKGERHSTRIRETARSELGIHVDASPAPIAIAELLAARGHFISFVYLCEAREHPRVRDPSNPANGDLAWFAVMPRATYPSHGFYHHLVAGLKYGPIGTGLRMYEDDVDESSGSVSPHWLL